MKKLAAPAEEAIMKKLLILTVIAQTILGGTATVSTLFPQADPFVIACEGGNC